MAVMEKRLQLLLDADRWGLVSRAAADQQRSAASVIREAIDLYFESEDEDARRAAAARALLAEAAQDPAIVAGDVVAALRDEFEAEVAGRSPG